MTGTKRSSDGLDARRRKLLLRSWRRGMREMDLILGSFADAEIDRLSEAEVAEYERLLDIEDAELYGWLTGTEKGPPPLPILARVLAFRDRLTF